MKKLIITVILAIVTAFIVVSVIELGCDIFEPQIKLERYESK